jgi:hypothetical protein
MENMIEDPILAMARDTLYKGMRENEEEEKIARRGGRVKGQPDKKPRQAICAECGKTVLKRGMKMITMKSGKKVFVCPDCYMPVDVPKKRNYTPRTPKNKKIDVDYDLKISLISPADHYKECLSCCGVNFHMIGNATVKCAGCGSTFRFSKGV